MKSIRYIFRLFGAFFLKFKSLILLGIVVGIVLFFLIKLLGPTLFMQKGKTIGLVGKYRTDNLPISILSMIGEGLTTVDESGVVGPGLADSWETPDVGQTWIFHLKNGLVWQDDKKVTAQTIVYSFSDAKEETPDAKTIVFKLQSSFAPFPSIVSQPVFKKGLLGTGEWKVTKASLSGSYIQKLVLSNKNREEIIYKFYPTEERAKLAFKLGSVDTLEGMFSKEPFDTWKNTDLAADVNKYRYAALFFNNNDNLLSSKELRQALAYAIDKTKLPGPRAFGPVSPDSWAYNPQVKPYIFDQRRANEIISGMAKEVRENLNINLSTSTVLLPVAEQIAKDWETVGVKTSIRVENDIPQDFQAFLAVLDISKDPDQYSIWHSTQSVTNIANYQDARIDKLLEDGRLEMDTEKRKKIYLDFQRFLVEDSPAIFLYHPITYTISRK
jgi:peptide/nickel transport system substrate-binding protein